MVNMSTFEEEKIDKSANNLSRFLFCPHANSKDRSILMHRLFWLFSPNHSTFKIWVSCPLEIYFDNKHCLSPLVLPNRISVLLRANALATFIAQLASGCWS